MHPTPSPTEVWLYLLMSKESILSQPCYPITRLEKEILKKTAADFEAYFLRRRKSGKKQLLFF